MKCIRGVPRRLLCKGIPLLLLLVFVLYLSNRGFSGVHRHLLSSEVNIDVDNEYNVLKYIYQQSSSPEKQSRAKLKTTDHIFNATKFVDSVRQSRQADKTFETYHIPRAFKVKSYNYSFSINGHSICEGAAPSLIIVVPSVHNDVKRRKEIRESWGSVVKTGIWADGTPLPRIRLVFFIAHGLFVKSHDLLYEENSKYGDIVFADFIDSYRNLTVKTMSVMNWVSQYCSGAQYILKNDEDTIVHLPRLFRVIQKVNSNNTFIGRQNRNLSVARENSKWVTSIKEYPLKKYPPYTSGMFYVIPGHFAKKLFAVSEYLPPLSVEDVFVTGILRNVVGADIKDLGSSACESPITCKFSREETVSMIGIDGYLPLGNIWGRFKRLAAKTKKRRH